uniref:PLAC domain-containing protein n=1 Tax=Maylandia zebra TaxID=106582 RepID=A0A3P9AYG1_9CICH
MGPSIGRSSAKCCCLSPRQSWTCQMMNARGSNLDEDSHVTDLISACFCTQCSQSCGGGVQRRQVLCKQRLADGSILELPDTFCPTKSPTSQQPCGEQECPPEWVTTIDAWSPCSATCGGGAQTRIVRCMKGPEGRSEEVESPNCLGAGRKPSDARPCNLLPCYLRPRSAVARSCRTCSQSTSCCQSTTIFSRKKNKQKNIFSRAT